MTVLVDEVITWPGTVGTPFEEGSCHLTTDGDLEELHAFAKAIGLRRGWFQAPPKASWPHYDLTKSRREEALARGAVFRPAREQGKARMEARRAAAPVANVPEPRGGRAPTRRAGSVSSGGANPVIPDPNIAIGPYKILRRTDGKVIVYDPAAPLARGTVGNQAWSELVQAEAFARALVEGLPIAKAIARVRTPEDRFAPAE